MAKFLTVLGLLLLSNQAFAYIDPGSGSFMLQMLIASTLGAFFTVKLYFNQFILKFKKIFRIKQTTDSKNQD